MANFVIDVLADVRAEGREEGREEGIEIGIEKGNPINLKKTSALAKLDPYLDDHGLLRVGGRLEKSSMPEHQRNPVILPKDTISVLVARSIHEKTHQGRGATLNAVRLSGYWIVGCKDIVSRIIFKCVLCRKLRGHLQEQKMAPLRE